MGSIRSNSGVTGLLAGLLLTGCAYSQIFTEELTCRVMAEEGVGLLTEDEVRSLARAWGDEGAGRQPDRETIKAFESLEPGATITVFLGTWCLDSRREVGQFLRLVEALEGEIPFSVTYLGVNRKKTEPAQFLAGKDVRYLPTFVVSRHGEEIGRIVERSPRGLEADLGLLLSGVSRGLVSASEAVIRHYLFKASDAETAPKDTEAEPERLPPGPERQAGG